MLGIGLFPALFVPVGWPGLVVDLAALVMDDDRGFADGSGWTRISWTESGDWDTGAAWLLSGAQALDRHWTYLGPLWQ